MVFSPHHLSISENLSACLMANQHNFNTHWQASFEVSVGLVCTPKLSGELTLELCYEDAAGCKKILVERCQNTEKRSHLLTGRCHLNVNGKIKHAELTITTSEMHMFRILLNSVKLSEGYSISA